MNFDTEYFGAMDVYCKLTIGTQVVKSSVAHDQNRHPVWPDALQVRLGGEQTMHVALYDRDHFTRDDFICETMVNLGEVFNRGNFTNSYTLMRNGRACGQIMINLEFYPGNQQPVNYNQNSAPQQGQQQQQQQGFGQQAANFGMNMMNKFGGAFGQKN